MKTLTQADKIRISRWKFAAFAGGSVIILATSGCTTATAPVAHIQKQGNVPAISTPSKQPRATPLPTTVVDTNPADPPKVISKKTAESWNLGTVRLPSSWTPDDFYARVTAAAGEPRTEMSNPRYPSEGSSLSWKFNFPKVKNASIGVLRNTKNKVNELQCVSQGFDPGDAQAETEIATVLDLCASANFPGGQPTQVRRWIAGEEALVLADLRKNPASVAMAPVSRFGTGEYVLSGSKINIYGFTINLFVR